MRNRDSGCCVLGEKHLEAISAHRIQGVDACEAMVSSMEFINIHNAMEKLEVEAFEAQATEARAQIVEEIMERADLACEEVDYLVSSALRHLPPALRAMPAREAIQRFLTEQTLPIEEASAAFNHLQTQSPPEFERARSVFEMLKTFKEQIHADSP
eukprot:Skav216897  [mRNA]  locus=scaffold1276:173928:176350:+ [translate_table: standard]